MKTVIVPMFTNLGGVEVILWMPYWNAFTSKVFIVFEDAWCSPIKFESV